MKKLKVLIGCEFSQIVTKAFRDKGHEAYSCDIIPAEGGHPEWHIQDDVLKHLDDGWDLGIFHPPCTYLTNTANKWLKDQPARKSGVLVGQERRKARLEAIDFFKKLYYCDIPHKCIENPTGCMSTVLRKPDQIIQPWMFGHPETKSTCLWIKGLPLLISTKIVTPEYLIAKNKKYSLTHYNPVLSKRSKNHLDFLPTSKNRSKIRSLTFSGIAEAMSSQWSKYLLTSE
jgi:hypothetical protein